LRGRRLPEKRIQMVPRTGLEPVLPKEEDFKSSVSTIPPPGQDMEGGLQEKDEAK
jgi:hypothetical protein